MSCYWGAWVSDATNGHIGNLASTLAFAIAVGKGLSIWNWIQLWNRPDDSDNVAEFDTAQMDACRNAGMIPMVSWGPESGWKFAFYNLDSILNGSQDTYLITWFKAAAAWGHPFFVRMWWEFTGSWTWDEPTQTGIYPFAAPNTPAKFVQAWQYVVNLARQYGATNISWIWCPANVGDSVATLQSVYPGDAYVDWVATDIYAEQGQLFSQNPQVELNNIHMVAPNKPVMISEAGDLWSDSDGASWWKDLLTNALPNQYPWVKAVVAWQDPYDVSDIADSVTLPVFQQGIASNYYTSNVYSNLNISPIPIPGGTQFTLTLSTKIV